MIRVLFVDDHRGRSAAHEPRSARRSGFATVGNVATESDLWPALYASRPDVVVLDHRMPARDAFVVCHRLKTSVLPAPRVMVTSSELSAQIALAAMVVSADAVVSRSIPASELLDAIQTVGCGGKLLPRTLTTLIAPAGERLDVTDRAILAMRVEDTPLAEIGHVLHLQPTELLRRVGRILSCVRGIGV